MVYRDPEMLTNYYNSDVDNNSPRASRNENMGIKLDSGIKMKIRIKYYMYNMMLLLLVFNQISHEALDPPIDERTSDLAMK